MGGRKVVWNVPPDNFMEIKYLYHACLFVLSAKGTLSEGHAGSISVLTSEAKKLFPDVDAEPVICLESDAW